MTALLPVENQLSAAVMTLILTKGRFATVGKPR